MAAPGWSERVRELLRRMNSFHGTGAVIGASGNAGNSPGRFPWQRILKTGSSKALCLPFMVAGQQLYSVMPRFCDTPLFSMERAATPLLGIKRYGAHLNGYTWQNGQMCMWLARRALNKPTYPGLLDNLAAGGIAAELGVRETLMKECQEEACIPTSLTAQAKSVGTISYTYEGTHGGIYAECQFVFDLELPEEFVPQVGDGEVQEFYLWPLDKVKEAIGSSDFKPNCAMVALDFLIRHSYIEPDKEPHYVELIEGLHRTL
ncbi:uncharacterized protein LOC128346924 isoform X4 [Hemicordylus capensis]|uniref:uncharacterized protein LOC128346924 isoform X4 n=1 Tax=Hemicordylus capensis TaxID=884348 RepID=UPI0023031607|nr:uncharacterized protein LOC128346924 isoform X4 [Hemicordylus capensis]